MLIILFAALALFTKAQTEFQAIDRNAVAKQVKDTTAGSYYPRLLARFNSFDSSLTNEDYRLLYYGFVFQDDYAGDGDEKKTEIRSALKNNDYNLASALCDSVLATDPVCLSANYNKALVLYLKDKADTTYKKYGNRYRNLLAAIVSSGDGLSCKTSFRTISVSDEYEVMYNYFEIEKISGQALIYPCDKMSVTPSVYYKSTEMYFDTSESMMYIDNLMKPGKPKKKKGS